MIFQKFQDVLIEKSADRETDKRTRANLQIHPPFVGGDQKGTYFEIFPSFGTHPQTHDCNIHAHTHRKQTVTAVLKLFRHHIHKNVYMRIYTPHHQPQEITYGYLRNWTQVSIVLWISSSYIIKYLQDKLAGFNIFHNFQLCFIIIHFLTTAHFWD